MAAKQTNAEIADLLEKIADLLDLQNANPFRIRAYREGAETIREHKKPIADFILNDKFDALIDLPNIGSGIAAVIGEFISSGQSALLQELEAKSSPEAVIASVPGIGPKLANRIIDEIDVRSLPELEEAAHDGRLAALEGFGSRRVEGIKTALTGLLSRSARSDQRSRTSGVQLTEKESNDRPTVALILKIDEEYRRRAEKDELRKIAPRRFNPENRAWLPMMNLQRDGWDFTAMFSNTAQAHKLDKTDDWVVIYYEKNGHEAQNTVVTETKGASRGKRVVRGRESDS